MQHSRPERDTSETVDLLWVITQVGRQLAGLDKHMLAKPVNVTKEDGRDPTLLSSLSKNSTADGVRQYQR